MRAFWKKNAVLSLQLKENLFSLAQMTDDSAFMRFYALFRNKDEWKGVDLNAVPVVFYGPVGRILIQHLGVRRIPPQEVLPSDAPFDRYLIDAFFNGEGYAKRGEFMSRGGKLIDLGATAEHDITRAPVIIPRLRIPEHREEVLKYELTNFWGDQDTAARLIHFHETGANRSGIKEAVFPELYVDDHGPDRDTETYRTIWAPYAEFLEKARVRIAAERGS